MCKHWTVHTQLMFLHDQKMFEVHFQDSIGHCCAAPCSSRRASCSFQPFISESERQRSRSAPCEGTRDSPTHRCRVLAVVGSCICASMYGCSGALHPCSANMLRVLRWHAAGALYFYSATRLFGRHPCSQRVLVRLSHPRPPDRNQHGCTVGVLPGPTRVLPMPRQYGIGRRAPTRALLSCAASWCLVVLRPRRRVDCLVLTFCYVSSRRVGFLNVL